MTDDIVERMRQGIDVEDISETERAMDAAGDEIERLRDVLRLIASYYANGAVRLNSDIDVAEIARRALEAKS